MVGEPILYVATIEGLTRTLFDFDLNNAPSKNVGESHAAVHCYEHGSTRW